MPPSHLPRIVVAGLSGDGGKSLVALGLIRALRDAGRKVAPFKKGPDYIDAAWLAAAAGVPGRNLDTYLMPGSAILRSVEKAAVWADIAVVEGNRGLYDGMTADGAHSTATLAKAIGAPVILVVDCTKTTRTVAALVKGCQVMDPELRIGGVVLNRVATKRQEGVIRDAVRQETGIEVLGAIPRLDAPILPSRHLGLVTAMEHPDVDRALDTVGEIAAGHLDLAAVRRLAETADELSLPQMTGTGDTETPVRPTTRIAVLKDKAFSFYYPENLEALEALGGKLVYVSPLSDAALPEVDGLYAGGGFPEVYAATLAANDSFRADLKSRIQGGLPVWAECGGLMYLSLSLTHEGEVYPMVGALDITVRQTPKPDGHGYSRVVVDRENPYFAVGTELTGHEFHYSRVESGLPEVTTVFSVERGKGVGMKRDGIHRDNLIATYTHLHALGAPEWAEAFFTVIKENRT